VCVLANIPRRMIFGMLIGIYVPAPIGIEAERKFNYYFTNASFKRAKFAERERERVNERVNERERGKRESE